MLTSPGNDVQRAFLESAFASANTLVSLAEGYTFEGFSPDGTKLFEWLYGTQGLDMMRTSVSCMFSAQQTLLFLPPQWTFSSLTGR